MRHLTLAITIHPPDCSFPVCQPEGCQPTHYWETANCSRPQRLYGRSLVLVFGNDIVSEVTWASSILPLWWDIVSPRSFWDLPAFWTMFKRSPVVTLLSVLWGSVGFGNIMRPTRASKTGLLFLLCEAAAWTLPVDAGVPSWASRTPEHWEINLIPFCFVPLLWPVMLC